MFNLYSASVNFVSHAPLVLAGVSFSNWFTFDGFHPAPVDHGLFADAIINAANRAYGANRTPISDQQIVRNVGKTPTIVGPTYYNMAPYVLMPVPEQGTAALAALGLTFLLGWRVLRRHLAEL